MTKFSNLRRKNGESVSEFSQRFNQMYKKIPDDIRSVERLAKVTYANVFYANFFLLLRERRSTTLDDMKDSSLEVESNIIASEQLKKRSNRGKIKEEYKSSASNTKNHNFF
jgi:hypothetical protein